MAVSPTYPGVYIEEIPSGVHTIAGVATSITAFVGYTILGDVNEPVHIFSFADFERAFGGLAVQSPLSYAVKQFFQNGGSEAYIVRVAHAAATATVTLANGVAGGVGVLEVDAAGAGIWGNSLRLDVDYGTSSPANLFNLTVTEFIEQSGSIVPGPTERFFNLSMNSSDAQYVETVVNATSNLIRVTRMSGLLFGTGSMQSGPLTVAADLDPIYTAPDRLSRNRIAFVLDGAGPYEFDLFSATDQLTAAALDARLDEIAGRLETNINLATSPGAVTVTRPAGKHFLLATSTTVGEASAIHFLQASGNDASGVIRLSAVSGAVETDAASKFRPAQTGTVATLPASPFATLGAAGALNINVTRGNDPNPLNPAPIVLKVWGPGSATPPVATPANEDDLLAAWRQALSSTSEPLLQGAAVSLIGGQLRLRTALNDANNWLSVTNTGPDPIADQLGFTVANIENLAGYSLGSGALKFAQLAVGGGSNGTLPGPSELVGSQAAKTGIYALEDVDLFNLLVMPDTTAHSGLTSVLTEAIAYCTRRRAFMIIDAPDTVTTFAQAQTWIGGPASPLRSRNAALYFPRLREPDPLRNNVMWTFPAAGAIAGLYARTDAERGVWKAPAGTSANIVGAMGLSYTLTDGENGALNPLALNCLRTFPVYGTVCWGARTARGADALTDEYKYVPVRRLALFLEESLYRGTQWVVFEPNDEPLWAQIRLNLGAFMHSLFAQGAFQGQTPRDAYFVRCDKDTTTQNDIDLGRVNIVVGFAPLKPAEFVIIQIQQIAGSILT
jgi:phage tail sheath protein FI